MKVLIVDDSSAMRMLVGKAFRQAGFDNLEILEASDGISALASVGKMSPDLVLSDWNMPHMTGMQLLKTLRDSGARMIFGFVTTETTAEMQRHAFEAGADLFILKPFTPERFKEQLAPHLG